MVGRAKRMERVAKKGKREPKPAKLNAVDALARELQTVPVIGVLNMFKLPTVALQKIKRELAGKATIKFAKKSTLTFALQKAKKEELLQYFPQHPALILTDMNPFKLYKFLQANKSPRAAKAGEIAPKDIEVKAGPTDLMPGPAISTLTKVGIPAKVEGGKIAVMKDKVICKAGETISPDMVAAFQLLKMQPMEIGLDLVSVAEGGLIYTRDVLAVDEAKLMADIALAASHAINLSVNIGWPTKQTMPLMIIKAFKNAKAVGVEAKVLEKGIIDDLLAKAKLQAELFNAQIKI
ncbi:MAG: 50S ribosomal protein L10 [Candidatus Aenigmatarchaeota archaeon]